MKKKILILAGGESSRWNFDGHTKHMTPAMGEPIIHRTQRILKDAGEENVYVVCKKDYADLYITHAKWARPRATEPPISEWSDSLYMWQEDEDIILLNGDCFYTQNFFSQILKKYNTWKAFGRWGPSRVTGKNYGEPYGWYIPKSSQKEVLRAYTMARAGAVEERFIDWWVYRELVGDHREFFHNKSCACKICIAPFMPNNCVSIDDLTEDFDDYDQYIRWKSIREKGR